MDFIDRQLIDKANVRKTADGYLVAFPRVARTGVQIYTGDEVGKPGVAQVRVYRPPDAVFDKDSLATFGFRPVTVGHPASFVNADNWADVAVGQVGSKIAKDGEFVRAEMLLMDAAAIQKVEDGTAELSVGYTAELEWGDGETPEGLKYDAKQGHIAVNHLAIVGVARGGHNLRVGDEDAMTTLRKIIVDGIPVEVTDSGATVIETLQRKLADASAALETQKATDARTIGELTAKLATADGEVAGLKAKLADAEKANSPAALEALARQRAALIDDAKKIFPAIVTDGKSDADIRRAAVAHKLGDAKVKDMKDEGVEGAFSVLIPATDTRAVVPGAPGNDPIRASVMAATDGNLPDHVKAFHEANRRISDGWKDKAADAA